MSTHTAVLGTTDIEKRFMEALSSLQLAQQANRVSSIHHTRLFATLSLCNPDDLAVLGNGMRDYLRSILMRETPITRLQTLELCQLLCDKHLWAKTFLPGEGLHVFQCFLIHALMQVTRDEFFLQHSITETISRMVGKPFMTNHTDRVRDACTSLFGGAWWHVAADLFESQQAVTSEIFTIVVDQRNAALTGKRLNLELPPTLT